MLGLLLFVSFILHAISLYWIIRLKRRSPDNNEIENLLALYTEDMKTENEKLVQRLRDFETKGVSESEREDDKTEAVFKTKSPREFANKPQHTTQTADETYPPPADEVEDRFEPSIQARALSLSRQGLDHTEIAKMLECGKGEIELLLKFHR